MVEALTAQAELGGLLGTAAPRAALPGRVAPGAAREEMPAQVVLRAPAAPGPEAQAARREVAAVERVAAVRAGVVSSATSRRGASTRARIS
jgi:hypothetical protein